MLVEVTEKDPKFYALQWTGTNTEDLKQKADLYGMLPIHFAESERYGSPVLVIVAQLEGGEYRIHEMRAGDWIVAGPTFRSLGDEEYFPFAYAEVVSSYGFSQRFDIPS